MTTPSQAIILYQQIDVITECRLSGVKENIARFKASKPTKNWTVQIVDNKKYEAELIFQFLAEFNEIKYEPKTEWKALGWSFDINFPKELKLKDNYDPAKLLADYTRYVQESKDARTVLAGLIMAKLPKLFPPEWHTYPFQRLISWDPTKHIFSSPYDNILQLIFQKMEFNLLFDYGYITSKLGTQGNIALFSPLERKVFDLKNIDKAEPFTDDELQYLVAQIQATNNLALPSLQDNWFPTTFSPRHEFLLHQLASAANKAQDFKSNIDIDLEIITKEFEALNLAHFGKIEDFTKEEKLGDTSVGLCEAKGKRANQEDYLAYDHLPRFYELDPSYQWQALHSTIDTLQEKYGAKRKRMGSTVCTLIARRAGTDVFFTTASAGDSNACFAIINPLTHEVKSVGQVNRLHTPDNIINPAEKARVDNYCQNNNQALSNNGRLSNGLAMSRSLGNTACTPSGLINTPEILFSEMKDVLETDLIYIWVSCDGLFEPSAITLQSLSLILAANYKTKSTGQLAEMFVQAALKAGSNDNVSVALAQLQKDTISLSVLDGHSTGPNGYMLAHEAGKNIYPILNNKIDFALRAQKNPNIYSIPRPLPPEFKDPVKSINLPLRGVTWDFKLLTHSKPLLNCPVQELSIQISASDNHSVLICRVKTVAEAYHLFNLLVNLSCQESCKGIYHDHKKNEYFLQLSKHDYSLLTELLVYVEPAEEISNDPAKDEPSKGMGMRK